MSPYVMFAYIKSKYDISKGTVWKISWNRICRRGQWKENRFVDRLWFVLEFCHGKYCKVWESGCLVAVETTKFGWILSGCVGVSGKTKSVNFVSSATSEARIGEENEELESQAKRFWELESLGINKYEQSFYEEYLNTICRNEYNRYEVRLPFKENHPLIHDNFELCKRRLLNLH